MYTTQGNFSAEKAGQLIRHIMQKRMRLIVALSLLVFGIAAYMLICGDWLPCLAGVLMGAALLHRWQKTISTTVRKSRAAFSEHHGPGEITLRSNFTQNSVVQQYGDGCESSLPLDTVRRVEVVDGIWLMICQNRSYALVFADQLSNAEQEQVLRLIRENAPAATLPIL